MINGPSNHNNRFNEYISPCVMNGGVVNGGRSRTAGYGTYGFVEEQLLPLRQQQQRQRRSWLQWAKSTEGQRAIRLTIYYLMLIALMAQMMIKMVEKFKEDRRKERFIRIEGNRWDDDVFHQSSSSSNPTTSSSGMDLSSIFADGLTAAKGGGYSGENGVAYARAKKPFRVLDAVHAINSARVRFYPDKLFYYEVIVEKLNSSNGNVSIGLTFLDFPRSNGRPQHRIIDPVPGAYGIDSKGNFDAHSSRMAKCELLHFYSFGEGDVIGCGLQITLQNDDKEVHQQLFFTKNGRLLGKPIPLPIVNACDRQSSYPQYYPTVNLVSGHHMTAVRANLAGPFVFDISNSFLN